MVATKVKEVIVSAKVGATKTSKEISNAIEGAKKSKSIKGVFRNGIRFLIKKGVIYLV